MKDSYIFYKEKLNAEYKSVFEQVEMYVSLQTIDETTSEERLGDLLDIFLSAQDAGKPVQKIVGSNLEQFCKAFCSDFGVKNRVFLILDWLKSTAWLLAVISIIDILWLFLDAADTGNFDIRHSISSLNLSMYFTAAILSGALFITTNLVFQHLMFKTKRVSMNVLKTVTWMEAGISFVGILLIVNFSNINLFDVPTWIAALVSCLYLILYYLLFGKRIKRRKIKLSDLVQDDVQKEFDSMMNKRFEKAKMKSLKKGKGELTFEEFLTSEEKSCDRAEKLRLFYTLLPIGVTAIAYIVTYIIEGFETYTDSVMFIIIMLAVEYSIMWGLWKIVKSGLITRRAWIKTKRNEKEHGHFYT